MYCDKKVSENKNKYKKSRIKSNHKHQYKDCLILEKKSKLYYKSTYCTICGKIGDISIVETININTRLPRVLSQEEIVGIYKDLEVKEVIDILKDRISNIIE